MLGRQRKYDTVAGTVDHAPLSSDAGQPARTRTQRASILGRARTARAVRRPIEHVPVVFVGQPGIVIFERDSFVATRRMASEQPHGSSRLITLEG